MASTEEEIAKGTKRVENKWAKGAGFNKVSNRQSPSQTSRPGNLAPAPRRSQPVAQTSITDEDFNTFDDDDKRAYNYVAKNYNGVTYPEHWAEKQAVISGISEKKLAKAANDFKKTFDKSKMAKSEVFKYPFWSAARDWDPEAIGELGKKFSGGLEGFKFNPDMVSTVKNQFY